MTDQLPKIMEIYLANRRRKSDTLSKRDMEYFISSLRSTREYVIKFEQSQEYHCDRRDKVRAFLDAIDDFAELLTGDREYFWLKSPSYPSSR
jgi:hypothetical protein